MKEIEREERGMEWRRNKQKNQWTQYKSELVYNSAACCVFFQKIFLCYDIHVSSGLLLVTSELSQAVASFLAHSDYKDIISVPPASEPRTPLPLVKVKWI